MKLILGDSLEKLKGLEDNSVDSIVTDPPYHLVSIVKRFGKKDSAPAQYGKDGSFGRLSKGFMGKEWDGVDENGIGIAYNVDLWAECLRVLKPGGHLLAFSGTRTYHRMAVAIEDAGFEVRDMIEWVYGSGFSKCTVWKEGAKRSSASLNKENDLMVENGWDGWARGGLKPAHEPICMARKPLAEKTVAENVLKYGTGGINIDESRVETFDSLDGGRTIDKSNYSTVTLTSQPVRGRTGVETGGRFPANLIHDNSEEVRECFPEQKSGAVKNFTNNGANQPINLGGGMTKPTEGSSGNASRFFKSIIYNPKASKAERNKGCEELEEIGGKANKVTVRGNTNPVCLSCNKSKYDRGNGICECAQPNWKECINKPQSNNHPTVKPIALMEYLIKMVTPKGGTVLDPFMGSGSTGVAAKKNGYDFIGIDMTPEYIEIAKARINATEIENRLL